MSKHTIKNSKKIKKIQPPKGLTIVYTGHGKGKTTAAMGLAFRAVGAGLKVLVLQFVKDGSWPSGEKETTRMLQSVMSSPTPIGDLQRNIKTHVDSRFRGNDGWAGTLELKTGGRGFVKILGDKKTLTEHRQAAQDLYKEAMQALTQVTHDVVVLDELISAWEENLLSKKDIIKLIKAKPKHVHLVLTGHDAPKEIIALADLVTEMKKIKHPFDQGLLAQKGIDY